MSPSSVSPTLSAADTATCTYCQNPISTADILSITALVQDHGLPVGLCLRCTLDELERLDFALDNPDGTTTTLGASAVSEDIQPCNETVSLSLPTVDNAEGEV